MGLQREFEIGFVKHHANVVSVSPRRSSSQRHHGMFAPRRPKPVGTYWTSIVDGTGLPLIAQPLIDRAAADAPVYVVEHDHLDARRLEELRGREAPRFPRRAEHSHRVPRFRQRGSHLRGVVPDAAAPRRILARQNCPGVIRRRRRSATGVAKTFSRRPRAHDRHARATSSAHCPIRSRAAESSSIATIACARPRSRRRADEPAVHAVCQPFADPADVERDRRPPERGRIEADEPERLGPQARHGHEQAATVDASTIVKSTQPVNSSRTPSDAASCATRPFEGRRPP